MSPQLKLSNFINDFLEICDDNVIVQDATIDDYKKLNDKCDNILLKIKKRKKFNNCD